MGPAPSGRGVLPLWGAAGLVLVVAAILQWEIRPAAPGAGTSLLVSQVLLLAAGGVLAGLAVRRGRTGAARAPEVPPPVAAVSPASAAPDGDGMGDVGALMGSFSRMLAAIEQQAGEIDQFAMRLEGAYNELRFTNARLKEFSFKDEVTGLYNRRFFGIRLEEEVSRYRRFNHPVSAVLIDLDDFKDVNDALGHGAGDETLRDMADILLRNSRGINVICRYGGDEFAVLLVETSKAGARLYADRIRHVLAGHSFSHGRLISASFGIASLPEDVPPVGDDLVRAADEALYAAKRAGKNRVSVYGQHGVGPYPGPQPARTSADSSAPPPGS